MIFNFFSTKKKQPITELDILFDNLDLILRHQDFIISNPDFYNIEIPSVSIANYKITLGELLNLWKDKESYWQQGNKFYYNLPGYSLSGNNRCCYFERKKGHKCKYSYQFIVQKKSVFKLLEKRKSKNKKPFTVPPAPNTDTTLEYLVNILQTI